MLFPVQNLLKDNFAQKIVKYLKSFWKTELKFIKVSADSYLIIFHY